MSWQIVINFMVGLVMGIVGSEIGMRWARRRRKQNPAEAVGELRTRHATDVFGQPLHLCTVDELVNEIYDRKRPIVLYVEKPDGVIRVSINASRALAERAVKDLRKNLKGRAS